MPSDRSRMSKREACVGLLMFKTGVPRNQAANILHHCRTTDTDPVDYVLRYLNLRNASRPWRTS